MDSSTGELVENPQKRLDLLIKNLEKKREKIIIPTPVLAEVLVCAGGGMMNAHERIRTSSVFKITPFDERAALECSIIAQEEKRKGNKKGDIDEPWQKIKIDRQIIAIALVSDADAIYSDDKKLRHQARQKGIDAFGIADLPLPEEEAQGMLQF